MLVLAAAVFAYEYLAPSSTVSSVDVPQTASSAPATTASPLAAEPALNSVAQTSTEVLADCESSLANIISTHNDAVDTLSTSFIGLRGLVDQQSNTILQLIKADDESDELYSDRMRSFAERTGVTLDRFIQSTVDMSAGIMEILEQITA
ncbi:MAG TPA: hypothetical protein DGF36_15455, partial [Alteromonas sp.]|nr:hypothetical protein [Alteromonas sp.]